MKNGRIDPRALVGEGYLAALNLEWAHPLGLEFLARGDGVDVHDLRHLPGGTFYGEGAQPLDMPRKLAHVAAEREKRAAWRREHLGGVVEPVPDAAPGLRPVEGFGDPAGDWQRVTEMCAHAAAEWVGGADAADAMLDLTRAILARLRIDRGGRIHVADAPARQDAPGGFEPGPRARYLLVAIGDLQAAFGQLYPEEVGEVAAVQKAAEADEDAPAAHLARLEVLYGLAQPGMRFFRGDKAASIAFEAARPALQRRVREVLNARADIVRLIDGDMAVEDVADPAGVLAEVEARVAPLAGEVAAQREDIAEASRELAVDESRLVKWSRVRDLLRARVTP